GLHRIDRRTQPAAARAAVVAAGGTVVEPRSLGHGRAIARRTLSRRVGEGPRRRVGLACGGSLRTGIASCPRSRIELVCGWHAVRRERTTMQGFIDMLLVVIMVLGLAMLGTGRVGACIRISAAQALALSALPFLVRQDPGDLHTIWLSAGTFILKV